MDEKLKIKHAYVKAYSK